jgi:uncharacterized protein
MSHPVVHFEILGRDRAALQRFYEELFGWTITPVESTGGGYAMVATAADRGIGGGIGAFEGAPSHVTVYVSSDDIEATLARAESLGGGVVMPARPVAEGLTTALFTDPEGHVIGLIHGLG